MKESLLKNIYKSSGRDFAWCKNSGLIVYNLGSGEQVYEGVIGVDSLSHKSANIVWNLDQTPWPIEDHSADVIVGFQVFEHLEDLVSVMSEVHRVLKKGGKLVIDVPYFRHVGAYQDPTHKHFFTSNTMLYFCKTSKRNPSYTTFKFVQKDFSFGWPNSSNIFSKILKIIAKRFPNFYDKYLSYIYAFPVILFELEAI